MSLLVAVTEAVKALDFDVEVDPDDPVDGAVRVTVARGETPNDTRIRRRALRDRLTDAIPSANTVTASLGSVITMHPED